MAWLRLGDTSATYPALLEVAEHPDADERSVDEVYGFFMRCAAQSAQHPHATDYIVTMATAITIGGTRARAERLIAQAAFAGLLTVVESDETGRRALRLLNDPKFVHIKTADVLEWEAQRRTDNGNAGISVPVRARDGDACRYCGIVVRFNDRRGKIGGTYDHRPPGQPGSAETSVVACTSCNSARGNKPLEVADAELPLLPPPEEPYYHRATRVWLAKYSALLAEHGYEPPALAAEEWRDLRSGTPLRSQERQAAPAQERQDPAPESVRPVAAPAQERQAAPVESARPAAASADPGRSRQIATLLPGPGRVGSGRVGSGGVGTGGVGLARSAARTDPDPETDEPTTDLSPQTSIPRRKRRGRRGGRNRPAPRERTTDAPE